MALPTPQPKVVQQLEAQRETVFTLEEFEAACNAWLLQYLPESYQGSRAREPISIRNLRHYAGEGLIDEPLKQGREARYSYRHLVQVLLLRRAMSEGYTTKLLYGMMRRDTNELEGLLRGDLPASPVTPARRKEFMYEAPPAPDVRREALDYLASLKSPVTQEVAINAQSWQQFEVAAGIEVWLRSDAHLPKTALERQRLLARIESLLR